MSQALRIAREDGERAGECGELPNQNPYQPMSRQYAEWERGRTKGYKIWAKDTAFENMARGGPVA